MADDVTLLPCPFCGAPAEVYAPYKIIRCSNPDCLMEVRTMVNLREERRAEVWNTRVSDPRIAALEAQLAAIKARRCETCKHWSRVSDNDFGVCGFWTDDRSTWHAYDDERCRNWQGKGAADADS